jgi:branched-chain amino acid transport system substrate-binding protein
MKRTVLCFVVAVALLVPWVDGASGAPAQKGPIKIGLIADLTSFLSQNGIPQRKAGILAVELTPQIAGRKVEFIAEDDGSDPAVSLDRARKLVERDKVSVILGPFHGACFQAVAEYCNRIGFPEVDCMIGANNEAKPALKWTWSPNGTTNTFGFSPGVYASKVLGYKTATSIASDYIGGHTFMDGFTNGFAQGGGKLIQMQWVPLDTKDIASYLTILKPADVFVPWLAGSTFIAGMRQIKEYKIAMPIVCPEAAYILDRVMRDEVGDAGVGIVTAEFSSWHINRPQNKQFVEAYQKRWNDLPSGSAYGTWNTIHIVFDALRKTGGNTSPKVLAKALDETNYEGTLGTMRFGAERVGIANYIIIKEIKVGNQFDHEILGQVLIKSDLVGGKMVQSLVK